MTITSTATRVTYTGNGATTTFSYTFDVPNQAYMVVELFEIATEAITTLTTNQYSVTGIGTPGGGIVTYPLVGSPLSSSYRIIIRREVDLVQSTELDNQGALYADVIEDALDYLTMAVQQINEDNTRSLTLREGDTDGSGAYDANGNRIINLGDPTDGTDAVNKDYVDTLVVAAGNVPTPVLADVGNVLTATGVGTYAWQAGGGAADITIVGGFGITFTVSALTSLTLPTTGTVATLAGTETLTNKSLTSPALTGTPTAPTAAVDTDTTQIATTAYVIDQIAADALLQTGGTLSGALTISSGGLLMGAATGGLLGTGTINVSGGFYVNGVAVGTPVAGSGISVSGTTVSINTNNAAGIGSYALFAAITAVAAGATCAASNLTYVRGDNTGVWNASGGGSPTGTWRNMGGALGNSESGIFMRTA